MWLPNIWDMYLSPLRRPFTWPLTWPFTAPDDIIGAFRSIFAPQKCNLKMYYSCSPASQWNQLQISETKDQTINLVFLPWINLVRKRYLITSR